jgi:hypothetical protein
MAIKAALVGVVLGVGLSGAAAQTLVMPRSKTEPALKAQVVLAPDRNANTKVDLQVQHMAQPSSLTPSRRYYAVWVRTPRGTREAGVLQVNTGLQGELKFLVPEKRFTLLITAEDRREPSAPSSHVVVEGALARAK